MDNHSKLQMKTPVQWLMEQLTYINHNHELTLHSNLSEDKLEEIFDEARMREEQNIQEKIIESYMAGAKDVQELIQKQAIEEIDRLNSEG